MKKLVKVKRTYDIKSKNLKISNARTDNQTKIL